MFKAMEGRWTCLVCGAKGNKWIKPVRARVYAREHLVRAHGITDEQFIVHKRRKHAKS